MSLIRVGLSETEGYAEGYEAIFGKKDKKTKQPDNIAAPDAAKSEEEKKESKPPEKA